MAAHAIYFIQGETSRLIKIGRTSGLSRRLAELRTASPEALTVLGLVHSEQAQQLESALHLVFQHLWVRGEWHTPGNDLLAYIAATTIPEAQHRREMAEAQAARAAFKRLTTTATGAKSVSRKALLASYKEKRGLQ